MAGILSEQDTLFGTVAFRNKLITQKQLEQAVVHVQKNPGTQLGAAMVELGFLTPEQVDVILEMQGVQVKKREEQTPPTPKVSQPQVEEPEEDEEDGPALTLDEALCDVAESLPPKDVPEASMRLEEGDEDASLKIQLDPFEDASGEEAVAEVAEDPDLGEIEVSMPGVQTDYTEEEQDLKVDAEIEITSNPFAEKQAARRQEALEEPEPDAEEAEEKEDGAGLPLNYLFEIPGGDSIGGKAQDNFTAAADEATPDDEEAPRIVMDEDMQAEPESTSEDEATLSEAEKSASSLDSTLAAAIAALDEDESEARPAKTQQAPPAEETGGGLEAPVAAPKLQQKHTPEAHASPTDASGAPSDLVYLADYLGKARAMNASDVHISATVQPFMRLHGDVKPFDVPAQSPEETEELLFSVLSQVQKREALQRRGIEFCLDVPGQGRYRAIIFKQRCGWDGNFHIIRDTIPTFQDLGLPDCLKRLTEYNQGLVLVTGPANAGKTTTLAALLDVVNQTRDDHIITVEKPVEYLHESALCQVTQREVGTHTESFAVALRAALREDPDIIMVSELRDLETLQISITASETGHLVFGTLATTSAANTISRLVDGFPVSQQQQVRMMLSESLRGIISQQLIPKKDGSGVALCQEILFITPAVSALIRDNQPHQISSVIQTSRKMGMCRFDDSLMELVETGVISGDEAHRRAMNKKPFEAFKGP